MRSFAFSAAVGAALLAGLASSATAQTVITQWNFNNTGTGNNSFSAGTSGLVTGSTALTRNYATMNATANPFATLIYNGVSADPGTVITNTSSPVGTYTYNRSLSPSVPSGTAANANKSTGAAFTVSTVGMGAGEQVKLSWSQTVGWRGGRYYQVLTSTTGTTGPFSSVTGGVGSSISQLVNGYNSGTTPISGTATVNVGSDGVIDFRTIDANWLNLSLSSTGGGIITGTVTPATYAAGFVDNISYTLPTGQGYENNPNFAFAIVSLWDPNNPSATSGSTGLISSFAGTDFTNVVNGYTNSASSGGTTRFDLLTVSAVPEPTTWAMLGASALIGGSLAWRRRSRCEIDV